MSFNHVERESLEKRLERVKISYFSRFMKDNAMVLDVGCGDGHISSMLKERYEVIGIDSRDRRKRRDFEFIKMDAFHMAFKDNTFDAVILSDILEHVENAENLIKEAARVLKDGGVILFSTVNRNIFYYPFLKMLDLIFSRGGYGAWERHEYPLLITPEELDGMMKRAGMKKYHVTGVIPLARRIILGKRMFPYYMGCYVKGKVY
ncbi:MAG: hypothetical protein DRQ02_11485 [Candidatus Latescibacterota bacterium]|nr:MAG: hypothetical protein DRQ02_11485 [Candidatus Latescibacterota bacterium]